MTDEYTDLQTNHEELLNYLALVDNKHDFGGTARCITNKPNTKEKFDAHWEGLLQTSANKLAAKGDWQRLLNNILTTGNWENTFMEKAFKILSQDTPNLIKGKLNNYTKNGRKDIKTVDIESTEPLQPGNIYAEFKRFFNLVENGVLQSFYTCHDSNMGTFIWDGDEVSIGEERKKHFILLLPQNNFDSAKGQTYGEAKTVNLHIGKGENDHNFWTGRTIVADNPWNEQGVKLTHWLFRSNVLTRARVTEASKFIFKIKNPYKSKAKLSRTEFWVNEQLRNFNNYKHKFQIKKEGAVWGIFAPTDREVLLCQFNGNTAIQRKKDPLKIMSLNFGKDTIYQITQSCKKKFSEENIKKKSKIAIKAERKLLQSSLTPEGREEATARIKTYNDLKKGEQALKDCIDFRKFFGNKGLKVFKESSLWLDKHSEIMKNWLGSGGRFQTGITESGPTVKMLCSIMEKKKKDIEKTMTSLCNSATVCYKIGRELYDLRHNSQILQPFKKLKDKDLYNIILDLKRGGDWEQALACKYYMETTTIDVVDVPKRCIFFSGDNLCFLFAMLLDIDCVYTNNKPINGDGNFSVYFYKSSKTPPTISASGGGNKITTTNEKMKYKFVGGGFCEPARERGLYATTILNLWLTRFITPVERRGEESQSTTLSDDRYELLDKTSITQNPNRDFINGKIFLIVMSLFYELLKSYHSTNDAVVNFKNLPNETNLQILKQSIFYPIVFTKEINSPYFEECIGLAEPSHELLFNNNNIIQLLSYCEHGFWHNLTTDLSDLLVDKPVKLGKESLELLGMPVMPVMMMELTPEEEDNKEEDNKEELKTLIFLKKFLNDGLEKKEEEEEEEERQKKRRRITVDQKEQEEEKEKQQQLLQENLEFFYEVYQLNLKFYNKMNSIRIYLTALSQNNMYSLGDVLSNCYEFQFENIYFFTNQIHERLSKIFGKMGKKEKEVQFKNDINEITPKVIKILAHEFLELLKNIRSLTLKKIFISNIEDAFISKILLDQQEENGEFVDFEEKEAKAERDIIEQIIDNEVKLIEKEEGEEGEEREEREERVRNLLNMPFPDNWESVIKKDGENYLIKIKKKDAGEEMGLNEFWTKVINNYSTKIAEEVRKSGRLALGIPIANLIAEKALREPVLDNSTYEVNANYVSEWILEKGTDKEEKPREEHPNQKIWHLYYQEIIKDLKGGNKKKKKKKKKLTKRIKMKLKKQRKRSKKKKTN